MIWRILTILAASAVIGAATHANVMHAGGYGSTDAPLIIAIAVLLAVGMGFAAVVWRDMSKLGAVVLALCFCAGEAYWLGTNAEREYESREAAREPVLDAANRYQEALRLVESAKAALTTAGVEKGDTGRLVAAKAALAAAETAVREQAALPGCRTNCRQLLQDAVDAARREVGLAQEAQERDRSTGVAQAQRKFDEAQGALSALPVVHVEERLSERFGLSGWAWDLLMAGLRSIAVMGGSIAIGLALHPTRRGIRDLRITEELRPGAKNVGKSYLKPKLPEISKPPRPRDAGREQVAAFLHGALKPDPKGAASLRNLYNAYVTWCSVNTVEALPAAELGRHLKALVDQIGLDCEPVGQDVMVKGATLTEAA